MRKNAATVSVAKKPTNMFSVLDASDSEDETAAHAAPPVATEVKEPVAKEEVEEETIEQRRQRWENETKHVGANGFPSIFSRGSRWKGGGNLGNGGGVKESPEMWQKPQFLREVLTPTFQRTPEYAPITPPLAAGATQDGLTPPSFTLDTTPSPAPVLVPVSEVVEKPLTTTMAMRIKEVLDAAQQKREHRPSHEERIASIRKGLEGLSFFRRSSVVPSAVGSDQ